jgi:hypothetical protein
MKKLLVLALMALSLGLQAQYLYPYEKITYYQKGSNRVKGDFYKDNKVKEERSLVQTDMKKAAKLSSVKTYNEKGQNTAYKNIKNKSVNIYQWANDSQLSSSVYLKKMDTLWFYTYEYNAKGLLLENKYYNKDSRHCKQTNRYTYNENGKKTEERRIGKNGKLLSRVEHDYDADGQKKETRYYDKKNKLKHVYTFACSAKGEIVKKEQSNYCVLKNRNDDGSFYEVIENNENGKIRRDIYTFSADSLLKKFESFKVNGKLNYYSLYTYNNARDLESYSYFSGKGKRKNLIKYSYNSKGFANKLEHYSAADKLKKVLIVEQDYYL